MGDLGLGRWEQRAPRDIPRALDLVGREVVVAVGVVAGSILDCHMRLDHDR